MSQDLEYQNFAIFGDSVDTFDGIYAKKLDVSWISGQSCTLVSMFDLKLKSWMDSKQRSLDKNLESWTNSVGAEASFGYLDRCYQFHWRRIRFWRWKLFQIFETFAGSQCSIFCSLVSEFENMAISDVEFQAQIR